MAFEQEKSDESTDFLPGSVVVAVAKVQKGQRINRLDSDNRRRAVNLFNQISLDGEASQRFDDISSMVQKLILEGYLQRPPHLNLNEFTLSKVVQWREALQLLGTISKEDPILNEMRVFFHLIGKTTTNRRILNSILDTQAALIKSPYDIHSSK